MLAPPTSLVRVEGELIAIIDIALSSNMERTSTSERWGVLQALFIRASLPSTVFVLVMTMALALEASTLTMLTIPLSFHLPCPIRG